MKREEADALLHQKVEEGELISPVLLLRLFDVIMRLLLLVSFF